MNILLEAVAQLGRVLRFTIRFGWIVILGYILSGLAVMATWNWFVVRLGIRGISFLEALGLLVFAFGISSVVVTGAAIEDIEAVGAGRLFFQVTVKPLGVLATGFIVFLLIQAF